MKRQTFGFVLTLLLLTVPLGATAQRFPEDLALIQGNAITFCLDRANPLWELEQALATEMATLLGTNAAFYEYNSGPGFPFAEERGIGEEEFEALLTDYCDVFMGVPTAPGVAWPEEFTFTQPYYLTEYVLISRDPGITNIAAALREADMIGVEAVSPPDFAIAAIEFPQGVPPAGDTAPRGSKRMLYGLQQTLLDGLMTGEVDVAVAWAPALYTTYPNPAEHGLEVASVSDQLSNSEWQVGGMLLARNALLRTELDRAIERLHEEGRVAELLRQHQLPEAFFHQP